MVELMVDWLVVEMVEMMAVSSAALLVDWLDV